MPVRRAYFLIIPLNGSGWGIRVRDTVYGQFPTHAAASEHAVQWARRMAAKGVEVRVLASTNGAHPQVVWSGDLREGLPGADGDTGPTKDARAPSRSKPAVAAAPPPIEPAGQRPSRDHDRAYDDAVSEGWPDRATARGAP